MSGFGERLEAIMYAAQIEQADLPSADPAIFPNVSSGLTTPPPFTAGVQSQAITTPEGTVPPSGGFSNTRSPLTEPPLSSGCDAGLPALETAAPQAGQHRTFMAKCVVLATLFDAFFWFTWAAGVWAILFILIEVL